MARPGNQGRIYKIIGINGLPFVSIQTTWNQVFTEPTRNRRRQIFFSRVSPESNFVLRQCEMLSLQRRYYRTQRNRRPCPKNHLSYSPSRGLTPPPVQA